jgi:hypothetical protein
VGFKGKSALAQFLLLRNTKTLGQIRKNLGANVKVLSNDKKNDTTDKIDARG